MPADRTLDQLRAAAEATRGDVPSPRTGDPTPDTGPDDGTVVRGGGEQDTIAGVAARYVAAPRDTGQAAALLRAAAAIDLAVTF
ncbi:hypothetical protein, partial [Micromonospora globispora]|uniref:hypothetical protein n=1 Tax=Micromonospora globispora TaxID=1450148 RepID=UPI000FC1F549